MEHASREGPLAASRSCGEGVKGSRDQGIEAPRKDGMGDLCVGAKIGDRGVPPQGDEGAPGARANGVILVPQAPSPGRRFA